MNVIGCKIWNFKCVFFFGSEKAPVLRTLEDLSAEEIKVLKEEVKDKHRLIKMATIECCKKWRRSDKNFQVLYWKEVVVGVIELYSNILTCSKKVAKSSLGIDSTHVIGI